LARWFGRAGTEVEAINGLQSNSGSVNQSQLFGAAHSEFY
jgi:hypothetical protein